MSLLVREIVKMGELQLSTAGIDSAKVESEILYCHLMKIDRTKFFMRWARVASERETEQYLSLIEKRATRYPLQYILGEIEFMGFDFNVRENVLIPRMETETLVDEVTKEVKKNAAVLDLCCGSGVIGISVAKNTQAKVVSVDYSDDAIALTKENAQKNNVNIEVIKSDMFNGLVKKTFDIIVSNPPYIPSEIIPTLEVEVKDHEPIMALDGGKDGLNFYRQIVDQSPKYLNGEGMLFLEIDFDQGQDLLDMIGKNPFFKEVELQQDLTGKDRFIKAKCIKEKDKKRLLKTMLKDEKAREKAEAIAIKEKAKADVVVAKEQAKASVKAAKEKAKSDRANK